jgi:hypothetical protein
MRCHLTVLFVLVASALADNTGTYGIASTIA